MNQPEVIRRLGRVERDLQRVAGRAGNRFTKVEIVDDAGEVRQVLGQAPDGSVTTQDFGGDPPPAPTAPELTVTPGVIRVVWDGGFAGALPAPANLAGIDVHLDQVATFEPHDGTRGAYLGTTPSGVSVTAKAGEWTVRLVARNTTGQQSAPSPAVTVTVPSLAELGPKIYTQAEPPTYTGPAGSALWYDADNGNRRHVWNGTGWAEFPIGAAAFEAQLLMAGRSLVVGDPVGNRVTVGDDPDLGVGIQQVTDGEITFDLTPGGAPFFAGNGVFPDLQILNQLTARIGNFSQVMVNGQSVAAMVGAKPVGLVAQGYEDTQNLQGRVAETGIAELGFTAYPGRGYEIAINGPEYGTSDDPSTIGFFLRYTLDNSAPTVTSTPLATLGQEEGGFYVSRFFQPSPVLWYPPVTNPAGTQVRVLLSFARVAGSGTVGVNCQGIRRVQMQVKDVGAALPNSMRINNSTLSAPPPPPPPPVQEYTDRYDAVWSASFRQSGAKRNSGGDMYQGYADTFNGTQAAMFGFDLGAVRSRLAGATIKSATLYLLNRHTYAYSGGSVVLGSHGVDLEPATYGGAALIVDRSRTHTAKGGWVGINVTGVVTEIRNSQASGFVIGGVPNADYGYWAGAGAGTGRPHFLVTYDR